MSKSKTNVNDLLFKNMGIIKEADADGKIELKKAEAPKPEPAKPAKAPAKPAAKKTAAPKKKEEPKEEPKVAPEEKVHVNFFLPKSLADQMEDEIFKRNKARTGSKKMKTSEFVRIAIENELKRSK